MKLISALLIAFLALAVLTPSYVLAAKAKPAPKKTSNAKVVKKVVKPAKKVLGKTVKKGPAPLYTFVSNIVNCAMPDGKTITASKADCDAVNAFWSKNKPSAPSSNNNSSNNSSTNNSSSNSNSNPQPTPTPTPTPAPTPSITAVQIMPCTSSSCASFKTVKVTGTNFTPSARVELNLGTSVVTPATYIGGNGSTEIITDFFTLIPCLTYNVKVLFPGGPTLTTPLTLTVPCS